MGGESLCSFMNAEMRPTPFVNKLVLLAVRLYFYALSCVDACDYLRNDLSRVEERECSDGLRNINTFRQCNRPAELSLC